MSSLLEEIRAKGGYGGAGLNHVDESSPKRASTERPPGPAGSSGADGTLTDLLQDAFVKLKTANAMSSDEEDGDSEDESWSDDE